MSPLNPYIEPCTGCEDLEHELAELKEFVEDVKEKGNTLAFWVWAFFEDEDEGVTNDLEDWRDLWKS